MAKKKAGITMNVLSDLDIEQIHEGTLKILAETGVFFEGEETLAILQKGGAEVDMADGKVKFPRALIEEAIKVCPSEFILKSRNPSKTVTIGNGDLRFQSHPGLYIQDHKTMERRQAVFADIPPLARLLNAMEHIDIAIMPTSTITDLPDLVMTEFVFAEMLKNTEKVGAGAIMEGSERWIVEMCAVTEQQVYGQINPRTPLRYTRDQTEGGLVYARAGHPICILPSPTLGANSPSTLAGTLLQQNAEHLAGLAFLQIAVPGCGVTLSSYPHVMDMRNGYSCIGSVEVGLLGAGLSQICKFYQIPSHPQFPITDSKVLDEQAAIEKSMNIVMCAAGGADFISNGGALETEMMWSPIQLVIDNEINGMVKRMRKGITVNEATLAVDLIQEVCSSGSGLYLDTEHTVNHWRDEQYMPELADRNTYSAWVGEGKKNMVDRAVEMVNRIIDSEEVPPLPPEQDKELDRILKAVEKEKLA